MHVLPINLIIALYFIGPSFELLSGMVRFCTIYNCGVNANSPVFHI